MWNICLNDKVVDLAKLSKTQRLNGVLYAAFKVMSIVSKYFLF